MIQFGLESDIIAGIFLFPAFVSASDLLLCNLYHSGVCVGGEFEVEGD